MREAARGTTSPRAAIRATVALAGPGQNGGIRRPEPCAGTVRHLRSGARSAPVFAANRGASRRYAIDRGARRPHAFGGISGHGTRPGATPAGYPVPAVDTPIGEGECPRLPVTPPSGGITRATTMYHFPLSLLITALFVFASPKILRSGYRPVRTSQAGSDTPSSRVEGHRPPRACARVLASIVYFAPQ